MTQTQMRALYGVLLIIVGIVVAIIGYLGVSGETVVAFQLPYFASAGVGAIMLMGGGAALLITAQMERDGARLDQLEDATRKLTAEIGRLLEEHESHNASNGARHAAAPSDAGPRRAGRRPAQRVES